MSIEISILISDNNLDDLTANLIGFLSKSKGYDINIAEEDRTWYTIKVKDGQFYILMKRKAVVIAIYVLIKIMMR